MSQHPQGYEHQHQKSADSGQSGVNHQERPFVHGYGNAGGQNQAYDKYSQSVPEFRHTSYGEHRDGRPNEMYDYEKQQRDYLGNPLNGPPEYRAANHSYAQSNWVEEGTRGLKDYFYKRPQESYSGTYGADYKPEVSKRKVGIAIAAVGAIVGTLAYRSYKKKERRRAQEEMSYLRDDDGYYGYHDNHRSINHSYEQPGYGSMYRNPYGDYSGR
ncbi:hypothetical protein H4R99_004209 [Coemansia sp. RSA 1722]|nr:hypothetical protein IWW45_003176 [Coemansia sp. RSA 485]KAJ2598179.1 hypothetical protein H4R99_004209 [Coemansia sp. RSA 1722]